MTSYNETPDLLTQVEAQQVLDASLDMLDALESLLLFAREHYTGDLELDVWQQAIGAVRKAGGDTFSNVKI